MKPPNSNLGRRRRMALVSLLASGFAAALSLMAMGEGDHQAAPPRGFDYWQPDWMVRDLWGPGRMPKGMIVRLLRHTTFIQTGVPKDYEGAQSTLTPGPRTTEAGGRLYTAHCASCHGSSGMGDGDAGLALSPSPALLAFMIRRPISVDEYLMWTISEGGEQFGTKMPAFKDKLAREDIWRVIAYMRAGFPPVGSP